jgi:hypothetical protein
VVKEEPICYTTQESWHRNWKSKGIRYNRVQVRTETRALSIGSLLYALKDQGRLNAAGILEHDERVKAKL